MPSKKQTSQRAVTEPGRQQPKPSPAHIEAPDQHDHPAPVLRRAVNLPEMLRPSDLLHIQRTLGNRAVSRLLQSPNRPQAGPPAPTANTLVIQPARFRWTSGRWQRIDDDIDDVEPPTWNGMEEGEIYDTDSRPTRRSTRKRTQTQQKGMTGDEDLDMIMEKNPEEFGLQKDEVAKFKEDLDESENRVDDSSGTKRQGMSGAARADKGDLALAQWFMRHRPKNSLDIIHHLMMNYQPSRHSTVNRDDFSTSSRVPSQGEALALLPDEALYEFAEIKAMLEMDLSPHNYERRKKRAQEIFIMLKKIVSANQIMSHEKDTTGFDRQGFEILHMAGRAVGDPTLELTQERQQELYGNQPPSMSQWTNQTTQRGMSYTPPQHPLNLAIGSTAANTFMMALEGVVTKVKKDFTLVTRAYAPRGSQHIAWHIVMTLIHNPSGARRFYYIDGMGTIAPVEVYQHMRADAERFVMADQHDQDDLGVYEYPTMEDLLIERERAIKEVKSNEESDEDMQFGGDGVDQIQHVDTQASLYLNATLGGGNCFFHAVYESYNDERSDIGVQQALREQVVERFQQNPPLAQTHFGMLGTDSPAFQLFATAVLTEGNWVGDQTPAMVADALRLRIVIYNPDGTIYVDAQPNTVLFGPAIGTVHIRYNGYHYDSFTSNRLA